MNVSGVTKWTKFDYEAASLFEVVADGVYKETFAGRSAWKSLIDGSSLQIYCNREGFNVGIQVYSHIVHARLGLMGNELDECITFYDSWIGFGVYATRTSVTTGNHAAYSDADNGEKDTPAIGYILVS